MRLAPLIVSLLFVGLGCSQPQLRDQELGHPKREPAHASAEYYGPILIKAACEIQCDSEKKPINFKSSSELFEPDASVRTRAATNGGISPPNLTLRLEDLADHICVKEAVQRCKDETKIKRVKPISIESGKWKAALPLDCARKQCTISPYDASQSDRVTIPDVKLKRKQLVTYAQSFAPLTEPACARVQVFESCMGDCSGNNKKCGFNEFHDTLKTAEPYAHQTVEVCMDQFDAQLMAKPVSNAARNIHCRMFVRKRLIETNPQDLACSAYRLNLTHCE